MQLLTMSGLGTVADPKFKRPGGGGGTRQNQLGVWGRCEPPPPPSGVRGSGLKNFEI